MFLVDSHCHLDRLDYGGKHQDIADALAKAAARGVTHCLCVGVTQQHGLRRDLGIGGIGFLTALGKPEQKDQPDADLGIPAGAMRGQI